MPSRSGWGLAVIGIALLASGRVLGSLELFLCGVIALAVLVGAVFYVLGRRLRLEVRRKIQPPKVHAGTASRVDLSLTNRGTRRSPVLTVHDSVSSTHGARLNVAPLRAEANARAAYRLPTAKRGIVQVGPLNVEIADPLGLARTRLVAAGVSELLVFPTVYDVVPLPQSDSIDPYASAFQTLALGRSGEDFHALRRFDQGDDLRRVHWPSTARHDELMVRQDERPSLGRVTIAIDNRSGSMNEDQLDLAVTIAGSIALAAQRQEDLVRVTTSAGGAPRFAVSNADVEGILSMLAVLELSNEPAVSAFSNAQTPDAGGAIVFITTEPDLAESPAIRRLLQSYSGLTTVAIDPSATDDSAPRTGSGSSARKIVVSATNPFPDAWNKTIGARRQVGARSK